MAKYDVFISYSSKEKDVAGVICNYLESNGVKCWIAPRDIKPGETYSKAITQGIKMCSTFLLLVTNHSIRSNHVCSETDLAFNNDSRMIPFFVENVELGEDMTYYLSRKQWIVGYPNYIRALPSLLKVLRPNYVPKPVVKKPNALDRYAKATNQWVKELISRLKNKDLWKSVLEWGIGGTNN